MRWSDLAHAGEELGFVPRGQVQWLDPPQLAATALRVAVAKVFAQYGDKRELQAVFDGGLVELADPPSGDLWIDYTADLGDGFDATFTTASLLAAPSLPVTTPAGARMELPRGHALVLGGDLVYPTASARDYEDRLTGPFSAALAPGDLPDDGPTPTFLALPANHDWYDGLSAFLRVFTRGRRIGAWRTVQHRSYFALNPVPGWWLIGLDSQLGEYIDEPQLDYFRTTVSERLRPGDAIILCTAAPAWVHASTKGPDGFDQLHFFEKNYLRHRPVPGSDELVPTGARVRLWLSGDLHHYARYRECAPGEPAGTGAAPEGPDPRATQMITCGLGGAFLSETHELPRELCLPPDLSRMRGRDVPGRRYVLAGPTYPDATTSRRLGRRIANPLSPMWVVRRNPGLARLAGWLHLVGLAVLTALLGASLARPGLAVLREADLTGPLRLALVVSAVAVAGAVLHRVVARLRPGGRAAAALTPTTLVAGQVVAAALTLLVVAAVPWPGAWPAAVVLAGVAVLGWLVGALLGCEAFALVTLTGRTGNLALWRMSGQAIEDHKGFLRICLRTDGSVVVHPVVADTICRDWALGRTAAGRPRPVPGAPLPVVRLVDEPIVILKEGFPP